MSSFAVLKEIGTTLENLISGEWKIDTPATPAISLESPYTTKRDEKTPNTLSIYLYQVSENTYLKDITARISEDRKKFWNPSLALDLKYLVTPIGSTSQNELLILGRVMQIFLDNPVIPKKYFPQNAGLGETDEIKILLHPLTLDDLTKIWNSFQESAPYRLSVGYMVTPVLIDSTIDRSIEERVTGKDLAQVYIRKQEE